LVGRASRLVWRHFGGGVPRRASRLVGRRFVGGVSGCFARSSGGTWAAHRRRRLVCLFSAVLRPKIRRHFGGTSAGLRALFRRHFGGLFFGGVPRRASRLKSAALRRRSAEAACGLWRRSEAAFRGRVHSAAAKPLHGRQIRLGTSVTARLAAMLRTSSAVLRTLHGGGATGHPKGVVAHSKNPPRTSPSGGSTIAPPVAWIICRPRATAQS